MREQQWRVKRCVPRTVGCGCLCVFCTPGAFFGLPLFCCLPLNTSPLVNMGLGASGFKAAERAAQQVVTGLPAAGTARRPAKGGCRKRRPDLTPRNACDRLSKQIARVAAASARAPWPVGRLTTSRRSSATSGGWWRRSRA